MKWRDVYKVHPAADVFPLMAPAELKVLAEDIRKNGLQVGVQLWKDTDSGVQYGIDGRNRLDAMEGIGILRWKDGELDFGIVEKVSLTSSEAASRIIALNIRRRHLSDKQRVELAVKAFEADKTW